MVPLLLALPLSTDGGSLRQSHATPEEEARAFASLAQAATRLAAPLAEPQAAFHFPLARGLAPDAPGPLAAALALPFERAGGPLLAFQWTNVLLQIATAFMMLALTWGLFGSAAGAVVAALGLALLPAWLWGPLAVPVVTSPLIPAAAWATRQADGMLRLPARAGMILIVALLTLSPTIVAVAAAGAAVLMLSTASTPRARRIRGRVLLAGGLVWTARFFLLPETTATPDVAPFRALTAQQAWEACGPTAAILTAFAGAGMLTDWWKKPDGRRSARGAPSAEPSGLAWRLLGCILLAAVTAFDSLNEHGPRLAGYWLRAWSDGLLPVAAGLLLLAIFSLAVLAGRGVALIVRRGMPDRAAAIAATAVLLLPLGIRMLDSAGAPPEATGSLRPPAREAALLRKIQQAPRGAVLDLPARDFDAFAHRVHSAAWHGQATPLNPAVARDTHNATDSLAARLTTAAGAEALAALGVGHALLHKHDLSHEELLAFRRALARGGGAGGRLTITDESPGHLLLALRPNAGASRELEVLESNLPAGERLNTLGGTNLLVFELRAAAGTSFVAPEPGTDSVFTLRIFDAHDRLVAEQEAAGRLPLAIGAGATAHLALEVDLPEPSGRYTIMLTPADDPALSLAIQPISITGTDADR